MSSSRRRLLLGGLGMAGVGVAAKFGEQNGLIPLDWKGVYGPGETLTYAAQRLLSRNAMAREFSLAQISAKPFVNGPALASKEYQRHQEQGFANWKLTVEGLVSRPQAFTLADLRSLPLSSQITHLACEEGWSYIAQWGGVRLAKVLELVGIQPQAKYIVYESLQQGWVDSIDMDDALHPQTILAYSMNGGELPAGHGGPLRMRVPRQLAYKSVKYIHRILVTDRPEKAWTGGGYSWFAGI
jgi:DMSO/TMAO reductase YedYZ molybdopterin-dependent catalytic subunit